jgi:hypothetical protein
LVENDAVYVFVGQSFEAFNIISSYNIPTINEMWRPKYFWRNKKRRAPHNLYTNTYLLRSFIKKANWQKNYIGTRFYYSEDIKQQPSYLKAKEIKIKFSPFRFFVKYKYVLEDNIYLRFQKNKKHYDLLTNSQIKAKNIVIMVVDTRITDEAGRLQMDIVGEGNAIIVRGGEVFSGKWVKKDFFSPTNILKDDNQAVKFFPGNTWFEVIPQSGEVLIKENERWKKIW